MKNGIFGKSDSALLFTNEDNIDTNFYYFTGLSKARRLTAYAVIGKGKPLVISNRLEYGALSKNRNFRAVMAENGGHARALLRKNLGKKVGLNYGYVSLSSMKRLKVMLKGRKFADITEQLNRLRAVKTKDEIKKISEACKITEKLFSYLETTAKKGRTEMDIANGLEAEARRLGAEGLSFPPIIASGKNSAVPHHKTGMTKLKEGILLADIGVLCSGYCSDLTRTFCIGEPSEAHTHMYEVVNSARKEAIKASMPGVKAGSVFDVANNIIKKNYGSGMIHKLGHGLGILVHDYPEGFSTKSSLILREGMCLTVEPGYYREGFGGIRIEDDIVIAKGKPRLLSRAPDSLMSL